MRQGLKRLARTFGADISRHRTPLDLSHLGDIHPIEAAYRAGSRPVLLKVPLEKCLTFDLSAFVPTAQGLSPFVHALREWQAGKADCYEQSLLKAFYDRYQPRTAADMYGIEEAESRELGKLAPSAAPLPWRAQKPAKLASLRKAQIEKENREHGARLSADNGDPFIGPVSPRKGALEYARLTGVYKSIRSEGFKIDPTGSLNIRVIALVAGDLWRWMVVVSGQHRLAALSAIGYQEAVVQLQTSEGLGGIVIKDHRAHFPLVQDGVVSVSEMTSLFERLLDGRPPPCADAWAREIESDSKNGQ